MTFGLFYNVVWTILIRNKCLTLYIRASLERRVVPHCDNIVCTLTIRLSVESFIFYFHSRYVLLGFYIIRGCVFIFLIYCLTILLSVVCYLGVI